MAAVATNLAPFAEEATPDQLVLGAVVGVQVVPESDEM
jgi:hypothetical protein